MGRYSGSLVIGVSKLWPRVSGGRVEQAFGGLLEQANRQIPEAFAGSAFTIKWLHQWGRRSWEILISKR